MCDSHRPENGADSEEVELTDAEIQAQVDQGYEEYIQEMRERASA